MLERIRTADATTITTIGFTKAVLEEVRECLRALADGASVKLREFACTMLVAIIMPDRAVFWQIGDGAMCFRVAGEERYNYAFWPEKGDFANVTFFVTDDSAHERLEFDVLYRPVVELASFSDGLERLALDFVSGEAHTGFFNGLLPHLRGREAGFSEALSQDLVMFLASERVNKRTDDDKTLILASRIQ